MVGNFWQDVSGLLPSFVTFLFALVIEPAFEKNTVLLANTLEVGRNEPDWSMFSGWFTGQP